MTVLDVSTRDQSPLLCLLSCQLLIGLLLFIIIKHVEKQYQEVEHSLCNVLAMLDLWGPKRLYPPPAPQMSSPLLPAVGLSPGLDSVGVFPDDYMAESFPLDFKLIDDLQQREIPTKVVAM